MLIVRYGSEAERKRFEYLIEKWEELLSIEKPGGAIVLIDGRIDYVMKFLEELYSRIPRNEVMVYKLVEPDIHITPLTLEAEIRSGMSVNEVWGALGLLVAKLRAVLISETGGSRVYQVSTKGGSCRIKFSVVPHRGGSVITLTVEGFGSVVSNVYNKLLKELSLIGEVIRRE